MRYLSLFSGIEAASVAWEPLGWEPVAFCEVDPFPSAVLAERFPDVPNLGDITKVDWREFYERYGAVDVLVGGSPCQSFSIAGNRAGLEGASGLMWEYVRAVRDLLRCGDGRWPRYVLWENVPGCLSSNKGRDFGCLLDSLEDLGYSLAWRTLDAQFVRVPDRNGHGFLGPVAQRRRRVFLVGCLGGISPIEVLVERESLRGDHPSSREARKALAASAYGGSDGEGYCMTPWDCQSKRVYSGDNPSPTLQAGGDGDNQMHIQQIVAGFKWHQGTGAGNIGWEDEQSPTVTADWHVPAICLQGDGTTSQSGHGMGYDESGASYTLNTLDRHSVRFQQNQRDEVRLIGGDGDVAGSLSASQFTKCQNYICMSGTQEHSNVEVGGYHA